MKCDGCGFGWLAGDMSTVEKLPPRILCPQCIEASPEFGAGSIERLRRGDDGLRAAHELRKQGAEQGVLLL